MEWDRKDCEVQGLVESYDEIPMHASREATKNRIISNFLTNIYFSYCHWQTPARKKTSAIYFIFRRELALNRSRTKISSLRNKQYQCSYPIRSRSKKYSAGVKGGKTQQVMWLVQSKRLTGPHTANSGSRQMKLWKKPNQVTIKNVLIITKEIVPVSGKPWMK